MYFTLLPRTPKISTKTFPSQLNLHFFLSKNWKGVLHLLLKLLFFYWKVDRVCTRKCEPRLFIPIQEPKDVNNISRKCSLVVSSFIGSKKTDAIVKLFQNNQEDGF